MNYFYSRMNKILSQNIFKIYFILNLIKNIFTVVVWTVLKTKNYSEPLLPFLIL